MIRYGIFYYFTMFFCPISVLSHRHFGNDPRFSFFCYYVYIFQRIFCNILIYFTFLMCSFSLVLKMNNKILETGSIACESNRRIRFWQLNALLIPLCISYSQFLSIWWIYRSCIPDILTSLCSFLKAVRGDLYLIISVSFWSLVESCHISNYTTSPILYCKRNHIYICIVLKNFDLIIFFFV